MQLQYSTVVGRTSSLFELAVKVALPSLVVSGPFLMCIFFLEVRGRTSGHYGGTPSSLGLQQHNQGKTQGLLESGLGK